MPQNQQNQHNPRQINPFLMNVDFQNQNESFIVPIEQVDDFLEKHDEHYSCNQDEKSFAQD